MNYLPSRFRRGKKQCPLCKFLFVNLPNHLEVKHNWSYSSASSAVGQFNMRKIPAKQSKKKDYHHKKVCPIEGCFKVVKNMGEHFRGKRHGLIPGGEEYNNLLKLAKPFTPLKTADMLSSPAKSLETRYHNKSPIPLYNETEEGVIKNHFEDVNECFPEQVQVDVTNYDENGEQTETEEDYNETDGGSDSDYQPEMLLETSNEIENILDDFQKFLIGPDKGRKARSVEKVVGDVRRILKLTGITNLSKFFENDMKIFKSRYLSSYCLEKKTEPGSVKKYIISIIDFVSYLIVKRVNIGIPNDDLVRSKLLLDGWKDTYLKKEKQLHPLKREADLKMLVTTDQVDQYEKSENCILAKKLFKELKENPLKPISQKEFVAFRDHVLCKIHFQSAHRSGITANMTIDEFRAIEKGDDNMLRIEVAGHKTVDTYGSGKLMLYPFEYEWLKVYVTCVRSKLSSINTKYVFASWNGNKMASGDISSRIHNLWKKAGNFAQKVIPKRLSNNIIRKSASTLVRELDITKKQVVADSMLHSEKTADIHYATRNLQIAAAKGSQVVRGVFNQPSAAPGASSVTSLLIGNSPRKNWSAEEMHILQETFPALSASKSEIKKKHDSLTSLNASPKQIYDKMRRMSRKREVIFC